MKLPVLAILLLGTLGVGCSDQPAPTPVATAAVAIRGWQPQLTWMDKRVEALVELHNISNAGQSWLRGYDLRQMVGQPGWFGSTGYDGWAGVGQAIPSSILHEVSHSSFGAFPVTGEPALSWARTGDELSPALRQYHQDLIAFMAQPPDSFEPLRARFRNLPGLSREDNPDIFHFGEADLLYSTGANRLLIPPILRKYFDQLLAEGDFNSWEEAIGWYLALAEEDRRLANQYLGFTHFPLERYAPLKLPETTHVGLGARAVLLNEQRQRLTDFAQQFDQIVANELSFVDAASVDRSFQFWRGYLRDMLALHKEHPGVLAEAGGRAVDLQRAFDIFVAAEALSQSAQVEHFTESLKDPFLMDLAVLVPDRTMVELFGQAPEADPPTSVEGAVRRFSRKLADYSGAVSETLVSARDKLQAGSEGLEAFLGGLSNDEHEKDLGLIFGLMRETDSDLARKLVDSLSDELLLRMLDNNPGALRNGNVSPERLLQALKVTSQHSPDEVAAGLRALFKFSSGNFQIDKPFTRLAYRAIADVTARDDAAGFELIHEGGVPLIDFIQGSPGTSVKIFSSDMERSSTVVSEVEGYAYAPQHIVHALIPVDPDVAARLVIHMDDQGRQDIAIESLIVFAFDAARSRTNPLLGLSLEKDRIFLERLLEIQGRSWLSRNVALAVAKYRQDVVWRRIDPRFIEEYAITLRAMIRTQPNADKRVILESVLDEAFSDAGVGSLFRPASAPERGTQRNSSQYTSAEEPVTGTRSR